MRQAETQTLPKATTAELPARTRGAKLETFLLKHQDQLQAVSLKSIDPRRLIKVAMLAAMKQPRLLDCAPKSILRALMEAQELELEVGGVLGAAYLVPFKNRDSGQLEAQ